MGTTINNLDPIQGLQQQAIQLSTASTSVHQKLAGMKYKIFSPKKKKPIPTWAVTHIQMHQKLQKAVNDMQAKGEGAKVPMEVLEALSESKEAISEIAKRVNYSSFLKATAPEETRYADPTKLTVSIHQANSRHGGQHVTEWEINYSLLYSAYQRTENEESKTLIRFLMINYLAKAAYLNLGTGAVLSDTDTEKYMAMLQLGQLTLQGLYHRTTDVTNPILTIIELTKEIGTREEDGATLIPMDTMNVEDLYRVSFVTTPDIFQTDSIVDILVKEFEVHLDKHFPDTNWPFPVLIDVTEQIGQSLITHQDPDKIQEYIDKQQVVRSQINQIIKKAADLIRSKYPDRKDIQDKASDYLRTNIAIVSRAQVNKQTAVLGLHAEIFDPSDFETPTVRFEFMPVHIRNKHITEKVKVWAGLSAVTIGAVSFRQAIAETCTDPSNLEKYGVGRSVNYVVPGKTNVVMYPAPTNLIDSNTFIMLSDLAEGKLQNTNDAEKLLAKATAQMIRTLVANISQESWNKRQEDPAILELTQTAVLRITQHLAAAVNNRHDFRKFSQAIDRAHSQITTLLTIYAPFDVKDFDQGYTKFLKPILPDSMKPTAIGLARSAMNVFTGVNAAILKTNPNPVRVYIPCSYYEEIELMGENNRSLTEVLEDPSIDKVDLYVAEFYHNIEVDPNYMHYQKGPVIEDIRRIFAKKPNTDRLTVTIDATIDFIQSDDMKLLLQEFEKEIKEGRLNIVVLRSGQKFDMLGLDNYFGSPFYIINNGDKKWEEFNKIKTEEVYQTDALSQQYFTWMVKSDLQAIEQYKKQIFDNAQAILKMVPPSLLPEEGKEVCVCSFEEGVKTSFIDIKINCTDEDKKHELNMWVKQRFMELFIEEEKLVYVRGSFGFAHSNITWIDPKMRINPGIDSNENKIYEKFFKELEEKVQELQL